MKTLVAVLMLAFAVTAGAETIKLKNGKTYEAKSVKREGDSLVVTMEHAEVAVPWRELEEAVGRKYFPDIYKGVDAERATELKLRNEEAEKNAELARIVQAAAEKEKAELDAYRDLLMKCSTFRGKIVQKIADGLLVDGYLNDAYRSYSAQESPRLRLLQGHPNQENFVDDDRVECRAYRTGSYEYKTVMGASKTVELWRFFERNPELDKRIAAIRASGVPKPKPETPKLERERTLP